MLISTGTDRSGTLNGGKIDRKWAHFEQNVRPDLYLLIREYLSRCRSGHNCSNYFNIALEGYILSDPTLLQNAHGLRGQGIAYWRDRGDIYQRGSRTCIRLIDKWDQFSGAPLHAFEEYQEPDSKFGIAGMQLEDPFFSFGEPEGLQIIKKN